MDEIIKKEKVLELQREIIEGSGKEYFSVLLLDLEQGQIFSYRQVSVDGKHNSNFVVSMRIVGVNFCQPMPQRW